MTHAPKRAPKRRWFRWSLRTLFVVVTVFAVWLGYYIDWIQRRHALIAKHQANMDRFQGLEPKDQDLRWKVVRPVPAAIRPQHTSPRLLWLFGEPDVYHLELIHFYDDEIRRTRAHRRGLGTAAVPGGNGSGSVDTCREMNATG